MEPTYHHKLLSRGEWFLELLTQWELLLIHAESPPPSPGKVMMKLQLEHAIDWLKRTYDTDDLMDVPQIEKELSDYEQDCKKEKSGE